MEFLSLPNSSAMRTVTILALDVAPDNPDVVVDFLTWFPCVEKLHMVLTLEPLYMLLKPDCMHICQQNRTLVHIYSVPTLRFPLQAVGHWKMMKRGKKPKNARRHVSLECLDQHLKMLELKSYRGDMWEVSLVRFFLSNARVLESLKFLADRGSFSQIASQREKQRWSTRASRGVTICFAPDPDHRQSTCAPTKHIHNLALHDPFDTSACTCLNDEWN